MTDPDAKPDPRAERLAAALRDNLRKRKAQGRAAQKDAGEADASGSAARTTPR